ncbi:beta-class carbonic anhydrase [Methanothermococcus okinawensis]|uniref:Carbonic anhydrase n=1 Tax=Methanothermococcus okinawensis (strain DSM 14208 / JCM 11175 / IH1) TaxID=647113 RepID=F8AJK4_METOI|nr:carbonic anhydrase [Methanothermococcus okinawensis]AEH07190.1 carbonic anhydrase [Methanothermococcus okinawensis IH1]
MSDNAKPRKKLAIVSCMDTRLVNFLSERLGIGPGDAKVIKNAGNIITDDTLRSLVVAIYLLDVNKIMIVGHTDCGMKSVDIEDIKNKMIERGANPYFTPNLEQWIGKIDSEEDNVIKGTDLIKNHPAIPKDIEVKGYILDIVTGNLKQLC